MSKILVIIPNYNRKDLLQNCIEYLEKDDSIQYDILVVDNGSEDGSVEYCVDYKNNCISNNFHYILLSSNEGFAKAVNKGLEYSIKNNYEFSILLNNDTEVEYGFVKELYNSIDGSKKTFSVSALMIDYYNRELADDCGDAYTIFGYQFQIGKGLPLTEIENHTKVFSACGGASIFSNKALQKVGLLDEFHFAYLEDIDLGFRANWFNYKNYFTKSAKCYHIGSATTGSKYNEIKVKLSSRNNVLVLYKNLPYLLLIINLPLLILGYILKQIYFCRIGFGKEYFFGLLEGFNSTKYVKRVDFYKVDFLQMLKMQITLLFFSALYVIQFLKRKLVYKNENR